jgi:hypothetical protein
VEEAQRRTAPRREPAAALASPGARALIVYSGPDDS